MSTTPKPDRLMEILEDLKHSYDTNYPDEIVEFGRSAAEAHAAITALMGEVLGQPEQLTIVGRRYGTDDGSMTEHIGDGEEEWKVPRNELLAEQYKRLTALTTPAKGEETA